MSKFCCERAIVYEQMFVCFAELSAEQQKILIEIRRRKTELLLEIQVSVLFGVESGNSRFSIGKSGLLDLFCLECW